MGMRPSGVSGGSPVIADSGHVEAKSTSREIVPRLSASLSNKPAG
jgi:hypothetical protein